MKLESELTTFLSNLDKEWIALVGEINRPEVQMQPVKDATLPQLVSTYKDLLLGALDSHDTSTLTVILQSLFKRLRTRSELSEVAGIKLSNTDILLLTGDLIPIEESNLPILVFQINAD